MDITKTNPIKTVYTSSSASLKTKILQSEAGVTATRKKKNLFNNEAEILKQVMLNQIWKTTLTLPLAAAEQTSNLTPF